MKNSPLIFTLFFLVSNCFSQTQKTVADKIVAQVGDKIILNSDIQPDMEFENKTPYPSSCVYLEGQLMQKILALQAAKDSLISVGDMENMLDELVHNFTMQYGSPEALQNAAGKDITQIREDIRGPFSERKLAEAMKAKIADKITVRPAEVKKFYEAIPKDSLQYYEPCYRISELIIYAKPNKDVEAFASRQLLEWKKQVETGQKKFDVLARLYSQDPGSATQGGMYTVNKNDRQWDSAWFATIWKLKDGQISPVVKSKLGLHIIQMVSRAGDDAVIRHILMMPSVTDAEIDAAKAKLDGVRKEVLAAKMNFDEAINKYSEDEMSKTTDGSSFVTIDQLDKDLVATLKNMYPSDISKPLAYKDDRGRDAVRLVYLRTRTDLHRENLNEDYDKIAARALQQKKDLALHDWLMKHISEYYVSIDSQLGTACENIAPWLQTADAGNALK